MTGVQTCALPICSFGSVKKQIEEKSKLLERAEHAAAQGDDYEAV